MIKQRYEQADAQRNEARALLRTLDKGSAQYKQVAMQIVSLNVTLRSADMQRTTLIHTKRKVAR